MKKLFKAFKARLNKEVESVMKSSSVIIPLSLVLILLASCNVHEWPEEAGESYPFILYMNFDTDLPLHKEVYYTRSDNGSRADENEYDIRYVVNVYSVKDESDDNRWIENTYTFSRTYVKDHNFSVELALPEGRYKFRVWSDHVAKGLQDDHFYLTSDFAEIKLDESGTHPGSNELRDAFRGTAYGEVYNPEIYQIRFGKAPENSATANMKRPMGRYEFISTDLDEFLDKAIQNLDPKILADMLAEAASRAEEDMDTKGEGFWNGLTRDEVADAIGLENYKVIFSYNAFMPSSYNIYTDKPSDSSTNISYESRMRVGANGMQLGFDYILVDDQTTMNINMDILNGDGQVVASTKGVEVPVVRSKNTIVKGSFLTVTSGGGVSINPDFDGPDFDIEIK